jgi:cellulose synthase/poly-beta-1,6-N-acetylglucosamine synthase-like glycosyltransferase
MTVLHGIFVAFGIAVFLLGLQGAIYFPLTLVYEGWKARALRRLPPFAGRVSVIVPAYEEERTIRDTVETVLASEWPDLEVVVVDDGSRDGTSAAVRDLADAGRIVLVRQENAGKAAALNTGIARSTGAVVLYTDADSVFLPDTVHKMARWFGDPRVDAVCGNDAPLRPRTALQKVLVVTTHIGTGFVRRALSVINCLPIISGNLGAIRRRVLDEIGGFERTWGEDLEITFRLHRHRKRIVFDPEPMVLAECPATFGALWRQRVRWVRSYLQIAFRYRDLFFRPASFPFSFYLPVNFASMSVVPAAQAALLLLLPLAAQERWIRFRGPLDLIAWMGLAFFYLVATYAIVLDRSPRDLRWLAHALLVVPLSYFYNAVVIHSWWKELLGAEARWDKLERRPVLGRAAPATWITAFAAGGLAVGLAVGFLWLGRAPGTAPFSGAAVAAMFRPPARPAFHLGVSTHFDAWPDWRDAITSVLRRPLVRQAETVGIGAGRVEWTYFRWKGHEDAWSNHQRGEPELDLLREAATAFHDEGLEVAAFVDLYAPAWIKAHPGSAAVHSDGKPSLEQVSLAELADGAFGARVVEMIEDIAARYPVDAIDVTEAAYGDTSFGKADLESFRALTGRRDWPRDAHGHVDVESPVVWDWKCTLFERFAEKAAQAVRRHGKRLYLDVAASWKDLSRNGRDFGQDYGQLLRIADRIVVWDYFAYEGLPPTASADLARHLATSFPTSHFDISIGLWGKNVVVGPADFDAALEAALAGGATQVWVTPNDQVTDEHWASVARRLVKK